MARVSCFRPCFLAKKLAATCSPTLVRFPPSGSEHETLKRLEDRLIGGLQPEDLLTLTRKAAEQGLIDSVVKANIESMDSSVPHPLVCRYLFYSVYTKIFGETGELFNFAVGRDKLWLNLLSCSNSAVSSLLAKNRQPYRDQSTDLSEHDIPLLTEILAGCSSKWREIGISLGLPSNELENIAMIHIKPILCLNTVLTSWIISKFPHTKPPRLVTLEEALGSQIVSLGREASTLRDSVVAVKSRKGCPILEKLDLPTDERSNTFEIVGQTPKANGDDGKSMLLEVRVRAPFKASCAWHYSVNSFQEVHISSVMSCFQGIHVFIACLSACDLASEGAYVCKVMLQNGESVESEPILLALATPIDVHHKVLTKFYTGQPSVPEDTWPPVVGNTYISLALIKQKSILCAGKYGRCTIRGDMDDIYADI